MARIVLDDPSRPGGSSELGIGAALNDGTGDPLRTGGAKLKLWAADINAMTAELFTYPLANHSSGFTLTPADVAVVHTNRTGSAMQVWQLPPGADGLWFIVHRITPYEIRLEPDGSQIIGDGAAGKYLSIQSRGRVVIEWMTDQWEVVSSSATYNYEV